MRRIAVLGDSMTFGRGAGAPELTFAGRLEAELNRAARSGAPRYDVVNLGIEGYQALQIQAQLDDVTFEVVE